MSMMILHAILFALLTSRISGARCPWEQNLEYASLSTNCSCEISQELGISTSCRGVDFFNLLQALRQYSQNSVIEYLALSNSSIPSLDEFIFKNLKIISLEFHSCGIRAVSDHAFRGLENTLQSLSLFNNELRSVPVGALRHLRLVSALDLSRNLIKYVPNNAFVTLRLKTLKLSGNNATLSESALRGLENSLFNLHLKNCGLTGVPNAILGLSGLNFLDLSSNQIRQLPPGHLQNMNSLTALNLEKNVIQSMDPLVFLGINDTLTSLSLLNNLITEYPFQAVRSLSNLKVLDLGFNLLRNIPPKAFSGLNALTLLAVDGNPLNTLHQVVFNDVRSSLKGLSLGGRFLVCDCHIAWISQWILLQNLQVTSREKNPQFCGSPQHLRFKNFYELGPRDLTCEPLTTTSTTTTTTTTIRTTTSTTTTTTTTTMTTTTSRQMPTSRSYSILPFIHNRQPEKPLNRGEVSSVDPETLLGKSGDIVTKIKMEFGSDEESNNEIGRSNQRLSSSGIGRIIAKPRDSLLASSLGDTSSIQSNPTSSNGLINSRPSSSLRQYLPQASVPEVVVRDAFKEDNSIIIKWSTETSNILGFRIVYRLFGKPDFKQGPPLSPTEREFRIKNVPSNECIIVCVISLEEVDISPKTVPFDQCRELRTEGVGAHRKLDYIIIPASDAIVATVTIAVIIFIACIKTGQRKRSAKLILDQKPIHSMGMHNPGPPLAELAALGLAPTSPKDWDQLSMYSQRSSRSRLYPDRGGSINAGYIPDDARSHISQMSTSRSKSRSINDLTGKHGSIGLSRADLRQSRQSLMSAMDGRQSRASGMSRSSRKSSGHKRSRSGSVYHNNHVLRDPHNDDSIGEEDSDHWATSTDNNWTDYDQDIYMHGNPTTKFGGNIHMMRRDDVNL
eukprot:TRINITY_DN6966_c0_g1_i1.p1 TRINITY_DN6966_c0_g1~~TRINITY_DN6966_c0_g1_i1.p1  ORF type:complete len:900 (+),score=135.57 TRINITY_DN6966_c0_g1_i1:204-2903(+)